MPSELPGRSPATGDPAGLSPDLQNLLASTGIATVFLGPGLEVLWTTPSLGEVFEVRADHVGQPFRDLTHDLMTEDLLQDAREALDRGEPIEREVSTLDRRWFMTRCFPWPRADGARGGAVVTFIDITARRACEEALLDFTHELERRMAERTAQVRALASRLTRAEKEERRRIALVLHDDLQQVLYGITLKLALLRAHAGRGDLRAVDEGLTECDRLVREAVSSTRNLTATISPPIGEVDLVAALDWLKRHMLELHGLHVTLSAPPAVPLPDEVKSLLFQIARELLFNVRKHARVDEASLEVEVRDDAVLLRVRDDGPGFDTTCLRGGSAHGFGLASAGERLELLGGGLGVSSATGLGTCVTLWAPRDPGQASIGPPALPPRAVSWPPTPREG